MKPAERRHLRTHQLRHSSTRRVLRNMKDGFCTVAVARIKYGKCEISVYSKVAVRPQHCCRCGIMQQLFTAHIEERLHQHISTHNVATFAKTASWFDGRTIRSISTGRLRSRSTSTYPPFLLQYTHGAGEVQPDSRHQTGHHNHGARTGRSRQSATTWFRWQRSNTNLYSASTFLRTGESLVQQKQLDVKRARNQTTSGLEFDRGGLRRHQIRGGSAPTPVRSCLAAVQGTSITNDFVHHGDSTRPSSRHGGGCFPPGSVTTRACIVWTVPRRLKRRPEGEKTVISPNTFSVKYSRYQ